jgi:hypothetical protein
VVAVGELHHGAAALVVGPGGPQHVTQIAGGVVEQLHGPQPAHRDGPDGGRLGLVHGEQGTLERVLGLQVHTHRGGGQGAAVGDLHPHAPAAEVTEEVEEAPVLGQVDPATGQHGVSVVGGVHLDAEHAPTGAVEDHQRLQHVVGGRPGEGQRHR